MKRRMDESVDARAENIKNGQSREEERGERRKEGKGRGYVKVQVGRKADNKGKRKTNNAGQRRAAQRKRALKRNKWHKKKMQDLKREDKKVNMSKKNGG